MTYRTDSAMSPPQGAKPAAKAPRRAPAPENKMMPSTAIEHATPVYHQTQLTQTENVPLPGTYRPAHPMQNGKG